VKLLFETLSSGDYDADLKAKRAAAAAAKSVSAVSTDLPSTVVPISCIAASNITSSTSSHGDVDMRPVRPGAVVQPIVTGSNGTSVKVKDYKHGEVYRPGHHGEPQQRRDWKRRSPQRMVC